MSMIGNIAVEGACEEILGEMENIFNSQPRNLREITLYTKIRDFVDDIRQTAKMGYY